MPVLHSGSFLKQGPARPLGICRPACGTGPRISSCHAHPLSEPSPAGIDAVFLSCPDSRAEAIGRIGHRSGACVHATCWPKHRPDADCAVHGGSTLDKNHPHLTTTTIMCLTKSRGCCTMYSLVWSLLRDPIAGTAGRRYLLATGRHPLLAIQNVCASAQREKCVCPNNRSSRTISARRPSNG